MPSLVSFRGIIGPYLADDYADPPYCLGKMAYEWRKSIRPKIISCETGRYEQDIEAFFSRDPSRFQSPEDNLMLIMGGIGTGKSTSLQRSLSSVFSRPRSCTSAAPMPCTQTSIKIHLDFKGWEEVNIFTGSYDKHEKFWNHVAAHIREHIHHPLSGNEEISQFWPWCLTQPRLLSRSPELHKFLVSIERRVQALAEGVGYGSWGQDELVRSLLAERDTLNLLSTESMAWYYVFQLVYELKQPQAPCPCIYLIVDNVDGLDPVLQRSIVSFAQLLCSILRARTAVAVRPLTWKNTQGEFLIDVREHFAPPFAEVMSARIEQCIQKESPNEHIRGRLHSLLSAVSNRHSPLFEMIYATSGISIRYSLRNLYNMLLSPVTALAYGKPGFFQDMTVNELARAYFFSDKNEILSHAFENLYVTGFVRQPGSYLLKSRILDFLNRCKGGVASMLEISTFAQQFGHSEEMIEAALSELMLRSRPLLWSEDGFTVNNLGSRGRVMLTPVGTNYINELFGEVYYDEICIAESRMDQVSLERVLQWHRELTEIDLAEIERAIENRGSVFYRKAYPKNTPSLAFLHWRRLSRGLQNIQYSLNLDLHLDRERPTWLQQQVEELLEP